MMSFRLRLKDEFKEMKWFILQRLRHSERNAVERRIPKVSALSWGFFSRLIPDIHQDDSPSE